VQQYAYGALRLHSTPTPGRFQQAVASSTATVAVASGESAASWHSYQYIGAVMLALVAGKQETHWGNQTKGMLAACRILSLELLLIPLMMRMSSGGQVAESEDSKGNRGQRPRC
jgi:hypothetical protein